MRALVIDGRRIADDEPCYVIAELGHNHGGSLKTATAMILAAAQAGASAVKLQKRDNATLYSPAMLAKPYENEASFGATYGAHREALEFGEYAYRECQQAAKGEGVACFATAFDERSADFLVGLGVPALKLASGSVTDLALLRHVARLRVPLILSTGGATAQDVDTAIQTITAQHTHLAVLHCTAAYPVRDFAELNLRCIVTLRERYPDLVIGWSGHDSGIAMAVCAYDYGARIIEKHFTLNRASKGTDHAFSLEPAGMRKMIRDLHRAQLAAGDGVKKIYKSELAPIAKMRRTLHEGRWCIGTPDEVATWTQASRSV